MTLPKKSVSAYGRFGVWSKRRLRRELLRVGWSSQRRHDDTPRNDGEQSSIGFQPVGNDGCVTQCGDTGLSGTCRSTRPNAVVTAGSLFHISRSRLNSHLSHSAQDPSRETYRCSEDQPILRSSRPNRPFAETPIRLFILAAALLMITVYARNHILNLAPHDLRILKMPKVLGG